MITNISLQDFKCFRRLSIDPKLVTVLIGPNGSGKSSVLQALMLLKQSTNPDSRSCLAGPLVRIEEQDFRRRDPGNPGLTVGLSFSGKVGSNSLRVIDKSDRGNILIGGRILTRWSVKRPWGECFLEAPWLHDICNIGEGPKRNEVLSRI